MSGKPSSNESVALPEDIAAHIAELRAAIGASGQHVAGWYGHRLAGPAHWLDTPEKAACGRYVNSMGLQRQGDAPEDACPGCVVWLDLRARPARSPDPERRARIVAGLKALGLEVSTDGY